MKFNIGGVFENLSRNLKCHLMTIIKGTLYEDQYTFFIISRSFLLRMRNVSDKYLDKIKIRILCSAVFLNCAVSEIMWKNNVERGKLQMTIRRMRIACWILKATDIHTSVE